MTETVLARLSALRAGYFALQRVVVDKVWWTSTESNDFIFMDGEELVLRRVGDEVLIIKRKIEP